MKAKEFYKNWLESGGTSYLDCYEHNEGEMIAFAEHYHKAKLEELMPEVRDKAREKWRGTIDDDLNQQLLNAAKTEGAFHVVKWLRDKIKQSC